ncbi:hypothetical protein EDC01DRAFT_638452 [Geopyxis carbonaria]|nr:hypothetical protein EDC01DRAFT_638452 [Geopyxis carbonaria]
MVDATNNKLTPTSSQKPATSDNNSIQRQQQHPATTTATSNQRQQLVQTIKVGTPHPRIHEHRIVVISRLFPVRLLVGLSWLLDFSLWLFILLVCKFTPALQSLQPCSKLLVLSPVPQELHSGSLIDPAAVVFEPGESQNAKLRQCLAGEFRVAYVRHNLVKLLTLLERRQSFQPLVGRV